MEVYLDFLGDSVFWLWNCKVNCEADRGETMRPYRGKRIDNGEWVEGSFISKYDKAYIVPVDGSDIEPMAMPWNYHIGMWEVHPDTVGHFTGPKDKNGKEICGGDKIEFNMEVFSIEYHGASFALINAAGEWDGYLMVADSDRMEVIGNIHENKELLKQ